jgi:hypothetical protein
MPLRTPTTTRTISELGLSEGGSLAKGYEAFRRQIAPQMGETANAEQTREKIAQFANLPDEAQLRALNGIRAVAGERDIITDEQALRIAQGGAVVNGQRIGGLPGANGLPGAVNRVGPDNRIADAGRGHQRALPNGRNAIVAGQRPVHALQNPPGRAVTLDNGQIQPQWHAVRNLPGYLKEPIRVIGRRALNAFTRTNIEDIVINSTLSNAEEEVRAVFTHIAQHGTYVKQPDKELMTFAGMFDIPDAEAYEARVRLFTLDARDYLLTADNFGKYVYSWPTQDRIFQAELQIEGPAPAPVPRGLLR